MGGRTNYWGEPNDRPYKVEGPCLNRTINAAVLGGAAGTFFGACRAAWTPDPITSPDKRFGSVPARSDAAAIARSLGRPAVFFAAVCSTFSFTECLSETVRNKSDPMNSAIGGMVAGAVMGSLSKRVDMMTAAGLGMGLLMFLVDITGPSTVVDQDMVFHKMYDTLPEKHTESPELSALKEKYPKFQDK